MRRATAVSTAPSVATETTRTSQSPNISASCSSPSGAVRGSTASAIDIPASNRDRISGSAAATFTCAPLLSGRNNSVSSDAIPPSCRKSGECVETITWRFDRRVARWSICGRNFTTAGCRFSSGSSTIKGPVPSITDHKSAWSAAGCRRKTDPLAASPHLTANAHSGLPDVEFLFRPSPASVPAVEARRCGAHSRFAGAATGCREPCAREHRLLSDVQRWHRLALCAPAEFSSRRLLPAR